MKRQPKHPVLSLLNIVLGTIFLSLFLLLIPWKLPMINLVFILIGLACAGGGVGLYLSHPAGRPILRITAWIAIGTGAVLTLLCLTSMSYLAGVYGKMGKTASGIFIFLILFIDIILILLPGLQLFHLSEKSEALR